jgi:hypothetical protein
VGGRLIDEGEPDVAFHERTGVVERVVVGAGLVRALAVVMNAMFVPSPTS